MNDQPVNLRYVDPLSEVTRKERKFLLAVGIASIVLMSLHEKITKIPAIETDELTAPSQRNILIVIACVNVYALVAFIIYAWSDFVAWRKSIARSDAESFSKMLGQKFPYSAADTGPVGDSEITKYYRDAQNRHMRWTFRADTVSVFRAMWDFFLPCAIGLAAALMTCYRIAHP